MATARIPSSCAARITRTAISPRLATSNVRMGFCKESAPGMAAMIAAGGIIMVPLPAPPGRQRPNGRFRDPILGQEVAMAKTSADLVAEAKQRVQYLTVDQVAVEIEQGDALL